jgi:hypothetical protein
MPIVLRIDHAIRRRCRLPLSRSVPTYNGPVMRPKNLGMLLLGIWLILSGVLPLLNLTIPGGGIVMTILAIAAGVCILTGR